MAYLYDLVYPILNVAGQSRCNRVGEIGDAKCFCNILGSSEKEVV